MSNALKFTDGEVRVEARLERARRRDRSSVRDTGIGIAAERSQAIFEEFAQVDTRLQKSVRGTGLGLPLSRKLAQLLGGDITVESRPGAGSVFSLCRSRLNDEPKGEAIARAGHQRVRSTTTRRSAT